MFLKEEKIKRYLKDLKSSLNQKEIASGHLKKYPARIKEKTLPDFSKLKGKDFEVGTNWGGKATNASEGCLLIDGKQYRSFEKQLGKSMSISVTLRRKK